MRRAHEQGPLLAGSIAVIMGEYAIEFNEWQTERLRQERIRRLAAGEVLPQTPEDRKLLKEGQGGRVAGAAAATPTDAESGLSGAGSEVDDVTGERRPDIPTRLHVLEHNFGVMRAHLEEIQGAVEKLLFMVTSGEGGGAGGGVVGGGAGPSQTEELSSEEAVVGTGARVLSQVLSQTRAADQQRLETQRQQLLQQQQQQPGEVDTSEQANSLAEVQAQASSGAREEGTGNVRAAPKPRWSWRSLNPFQRRSAETNDGAEGAPR